VDLPVPFSLGESACAALRGADLVAFQTLVPSCRSAMHAEPSARRPPSKRSTSPGLLAVAADQGSWITLTHQQSSPAPRGCRHHVVYSTGRQAASYVSPIRYRAGREQRRRVYYDDDAACPVAVYTAGLCLSSTVQLTYYKCGSMHGDAFNFSTSSSILKRV
jgi:hypothetical protein